MKLPLVPSVPGPDPSAALRWASDWWADDGDGGTVDTGAAPAEERDEATAAVDPRLAVPPLRVDRASDAARNPVLTAADVADVSHVTFVADPFVVRGADDGSSADGGPYHCFFEIKRRNRHPLFGLRSTEPRFDVGHATSPDGRDWTYQGVVLPASQAEHTYPHVFRHDGEWYMVPSPAGGTANELRIYRAAPFPTNWDLVDRALAGEVRIDPTPFRYDGTWFLVYQAPGSTGYEVRLRYSDRLLGGDWQEHPASPLFEPGGNDIAPGGRPLVRPGDGVVDLFFRRGTPGIVEAWRALDPSPDAFPLRELPTSPVVSGSGDAGTWDERNVHHVDAGLARDGGADLVLVDGQDAARDYRLGVARTEPFDAHVRADLDPQRIPPGKRVSLASTPTLDPDGACRDGTVRAPGAGWYRAAARVDVSPREHCRVELRLRAGAATETVTFAAGTDGRGRAELGPVGLEADDAVGLELAHDGARGLRVTGGELRLSGW
jgi:hypothetical protein